MALLLAVAAAPAVAQEPRRVMAEGSGPVSPGSPLWVVLVNPDAPSTRVLVREKFGGTGGARDWIQMPDLPARVSQVTTYGSELVVVIESADQPATQWAWFSIARFSYGPRLGRETQILAMAGDRRSLWALGEPPAVVPPVPAPATLPADPPSQPELYLLKGEKWIPQQARWPEDLPAERAWHYSMAIVQGRPTLAVPSGDAIHLLQFEGAAWVRLSQVAVTDPAYFKVLELDQRPALWVQPSGENSIGGIWVGGSYMPLEWTGPMPATDSADVTVAGDQIRLFYKPAEQVMEQRYRLTGERELEEPVAIRPLVQQGDDQMQWVTIAILAVLSVLILNTLLRRRAMQRDEEKEE
jgi:hypothetical protein